METLISINTCYLELCFSLSEVVIKQKVDNTVYSVYTREFNRVSSTIYTLDW